MLQRLILASALFICARIVMADSVSLYDVYLKALESDPRIKISQLQIEISKAQHDSAFGQLLPQISFNASISDNTAENVKIIPRNKQEYHGERYSLQARQVLFNWQVLSGNALARQVVSQREAEHKNMMSILLVDVADRYFQILLADDDLKLSKAEEKLVRQQLRETEARYKRKLVKITDFLETRARSDRARTDLIEAENSAALARESLTELTGTEISDLTPVKKDFILPKLTHDMVHWTERALSSNPLLQSKKLAVLVAKESLQKYKGEHYPTVELVLNGQRTDVGYDNLVAPERDTKYIGVDINIPIYSGGSSSARVREARSQYYIAQEEEEKTRRDVLKRTREAWFNTVSSRKRIDSAALSVNSSNKLFEAMNKSFTYGIVTAADVLEALRSKTRAQRDYQDALYSFLTNWLVLKRESGELQEADLQQLSNGLITSHL